MRGVSGSNSGRYSLPLEMPVGRTRRLALGAPPVGAVDQDARQMGDRARRGTLGHAPKQVPFGSGLVLVERRSNGISPSEDRAHEIRLLGEQERIPARLEIGVRARAVGQKLVVVDVGEDGGGRRGELERDLGERVRRDDVARAHDAEPVEIRPCRELPQSAQHRRLVGGRQDRRRAAGLRVERGEGLGARAGARIRVVDHDETEPRHVLERGHAFSEQHVVEVAFRVVLRGPCRVVREPVGAHPIALDQLVEATAAQDAPRLAREMRQEPRVGAHAPPLALERLAQRAGTGNAAGSHFREFGWNAVARASARLASADCRPEAASRRNPDGRYGAAASTKIRP